MGSCQSTTHQETGVASRSVPMEKITPEVSSTEVTLNSPKTLVPGYVPEAPQKEPEKQECAPKTDDDPFKEIPPVQYEEALNDLDEKAAPKKNENRRKLRVGYSSGGSSVCSDDSGDRRPSTASSRNHLLDIKHSMSVEDLCQGVVRIETDFGRPIEELYEGVHDGPVLGSGVAGIVRQVKHKKTGVNYAVKCLDLGLIQDEKGLQALREEVAIMCQLDHPNIVRLEEVYENESEIYLVQELCTGGDLFERLDEQSDFHYSESKCARLVKQMLSSIRYLHSKKIIHRDLKLENFLFSTRDRDSELKMIDFGLSKHFSYPGELQNESVGTPYTVAPEIIVSQYDEKVDLWALGVITFLLLSGETPFGGVDGESLATVRTNILQGHCHFEPTEIWGHVSDLGKKFVKRLLNPDPSKRPTAKEAQLDEWLQTFGKRQAVIGKTLNPNLCQALVEFKEYSDMRKVLCEVLSFTLLPEQIVDLRREFGKVDPDGEGEISLGTLKRVLMDSAEDGTLGSLTEGEIEGIFNALRVKKTETKIRWHEFIAAGLSQCNFDERNLKLAFDRLDYDRKGFITIDDMKGVLGTTAGEEDEALSRMWQDGLAEFVCPLGRITYDQFRMFIKGQKRDKEVEIGGQRRRVKRVSIDSASLQSVPEGSMSPQVPSPVFARFEDQSALDALRLPSLSLLEAGDSPRSPKNINIKVPTELPFMAKPIPKRRSRSLGGETDLERSVIKEELEEEGLDEEGPVVTPRRSSGIVRPSHAIIQLQDVIRDESKTSLEVSRALYRKHREFRQSVISASKLFDQKRKARKLQIAEQTSSGHEKASLVMRRGATPTVASSLNRSLMSRSEHKSKTQTPTATTLPKVPLADDLEHDQSKKVAEASKRSGRVRRPRQKTISDISGMLR